MKTVLGSIACFAAGLALAWPSQTLLIVALLGFFQNIAFTFVSRGRNSGSLGYHMVASLFSNGLWILMFMTAIGAVTKAASPDLMFGVVYVLSTMSGSVFAHWLAMRLERGKGRNVQEDELQQLAETCGRQEEALHGLSNKLNKVASSLDTTQDVVVGLQENLGQNDRRAHTARGDLRNRVVYLEKTVRQHETDLDRLKIRDVDLKTVETNLAKLIPQVHTNADSVASLEGFAFTDDGLSRLCVLKEQIKGALEELEEVSKKCEDMTDPLMFVSNAILDDDGNSRIQGLKDSIEWVRSAITDDDGRFRINKLEDRIEVVELADKSGNVESIGRDNDELRETLEGIYARFERLEPTGAKKIRDRLELIDTKVRELEKDATATEAEQERVSDLLSKLEVRNTGAVYTDAQEGLASTEEPEDPKMRLLRNALSLLLPGMMRVEKITGDLSKLSRDDVNNLRIGFKKAGFGTSASQFGKLLGIMNEEHEELESKRRALELQNTRNQQKSDDRLTGADMLRSALQKIDEEKRNASK